MGDRRHLRGQQDGSEGADRLAAAIEAMLTLGDADAGAWRPPILRTRATTGLGVAELLEAVDAFRAHTAAAQHRAAPGAPRAPAARAARGPVPWIMSIATCWRRANSTTCSEDCGPRPRPVHGRRADSGAGPRKGLDTVKATLDHIGIAVGDLSQALAFYATRSAEVEPPEEVPAAASGRTSSPSARRPSSCSADVARVADREVHRQARPRRATTSRCASRPPRRAGRPQGGAACG